MMKWKSRWDRVEVAYFGFSEVPGVRAEPDISSGQQLVIQLPQIWRSIVMGWALAGETREGSGRSGALRYSNCPTLQKEKPKGKDCALGHTEDSCWS